MTTAAHCPARRLPANSQLFRLLADTVDGANVSANLSSLVEICKTQGIDPYRYIAWQFKSCPWRRVSTITTRSCLGTRPPSSAESCPSRSRSDGARLLIAYKELLSKDVYSMP
jgi:hypothetical protein